MEISPEMIQQGIDLATKLGLGLITAAVVLVIGRWIAKGLTRLVRRSLRRYEVDVTLERFASNLVYALLMTIVAIAAINQLGVQTTSLVAVVGAAGLAVGLALQGSLANFAAGVLIVLFRPYQAGDMIEAAGESGVVQEVQIFTTIINTLDNKKVIIPNSQIMGGSITNYTANELRRVDLVAGVSYEDDLDKVKAALQDVVAADKRVVADPAPTIAVSEMADSSVNFVVRPWVTPDDYWDVYFDLTEAIKKRFDQEGISIPFPQRDVHIYQQDGSSS
jgi:small conductance mechanosensitive channel